MTQDICPRCSGDKIVASSTQVRLEGDPFNGKYAYVANPCPSCNGTGRVTPPRRYPWVIAGVGAFAAIVVSLWWTAYVFDLYDLEDVGLRLWCAGLFCGIAACLPGLISALHYISMRGK